MRSASLELPSIPRWSFLCIGAGALGTYIGTSLILAGQRVVFLVRPTTAEVLRARGLRLVLNGMTHTIPEPLLVTSLDEALTRGPYDIGLVTIKAYDVEALARDLLPYRAALPPLVCLQNGVESEAILARVVGESNVVSATLTSAVARPAPGEAVLERLRGIGVAGDHKLIPPLLAILNAAGLHAREYPNAMAMKWSKLLTNLLGNASAAILDMTPAEIFAHPGLYAMEVGQVREALAVMRALRLRVVNLPGTPLRPLVVLMNTLPLCLSQRVLSPFLSRGRGRKMPSLHIDLHGGRGQTEVDFLNGAVVRWGQRLGIPTPINRVLNETLLALSRGDLPLTTFQKRPEVLLDLVQRAREESYTHERT
ncbi:2-dehydropantoate 2-reductase [uncultured Thermanaerothrix sp.]|uniref:ketopantoate reductase family protein n=1 Tax=uncultured Thermanaerothrix sp. TaxID=1195149 RepID=UPI00260E00D6|nr:2-dehydropantoate 2-reductase [uncultured Thermanaerothrix sp.]